MFGDCYGWREAPHQTQLPNFFSPQLTLLPQLMICLVADSLSSNGSWSTLKPLKCKCAKSQEHIRHHMHTTMAILCPRVSLDKSVCVELCIKMIFNIFIKIFNQCKWIPIVKFLVPLGFMRNVVVSIWPFAKPRNHSCETIKISWDDYWDHIQDVTIYTSGALYWNDWWCWSEWHEWIYVPGISIGGSRLTLVLSNSELVGGLQDIGEIHEGFAKRIRLAIRQPLVDLGTGVDIDRINTLFWKFCYNNEWVYIIII